ncbi:MAG: hypothetical protein IJ112_07490 [Oscillospiraceae bacterium]|nr:hypothetical protein [Oscillospiraceae bacterium]
MKKEYRKPALYAESFKLAEHIAACQVAVVFQAQGCGEQNYNGLVIFGMNCNEDAQSMWLQTDLAEFPDLWDYAHLSALGLDCYNSFLTSDSFFIS